MFTFDLLNPWITFILTLVPLLYVQRWIHRHLFGMGYLLAKEKFSAALLYYVILLPGVILHELSRYLMAGIVNVRSAYVSLWPEVKDDGSLEIGFIRLELVLNPVYHAMITFAPFITGLIVVIFVSNSILDLPAFFAKLQTADIYQIGAAVQELVSKPDFLLWAYILFSVANTMMPTSQARRAWWFLGAASIGFLLFIVGIGLGRFVINWLAGPIASVLYSFSAVFGTVLFLDCVGAVVIWIIEKIMERAVGYKVEYQAQARALPASTRQQSTFRSVYELNLPIPPAPGKITTPPAPRLAPGERSPVPATTSQPVPQPARPALTTSETERPRTPALPAPAPSAVVPAKPNVPEPAKPGTPATGQPARPFGATPSKPGEPAKPGTPATGQPARPFGSTPGTPSRPGTPAPASGSPAAPAANQPGRPFGGTPSKPAASTGGTPSTSGAASGQPGRPFGSTPGTPSRPGTPSPSTSTPSRPGAPSASPGARSAPFGSPRPAPKPTDDDDIIDADVIDDEDDDYEDDDDVKYVDMDEA
jgi:hypothetical protein